MVDPQRRQTNAIFANWQVYYLNFVTAKTPLNSVNVINVSNTILYTFCSQGISHSVSASSY